MCAYYDYEMNHEDGIMKRKGNEKHTSLPPLNYSMIQKLMKKFKVHRGALDFDKSFILQNVVDY